MRLLCFTYERLKLWITVERLKTIVGKYVIVKTRIVPESLFEIRQRVADVMLAHIQAGKIVTGIGL